MSKHPQVTYFSLKETHLASGVVVVIDVLRAFTTAAFAFDRGACQIIPVGKVEEAFSLRNKFPGSLVMGEAQGCRVAGFDFSNSPAEMQNAAVVGKTLIQRTSAGTQGIIRVSSSQSVIAASFVVARATACALVKTQTDEISFIITGQSQGRDGDEDRACAEYIAALMTDDKCEPQPYLDRVRTSSVGLAFRSGQLGYLSQEDLALCQDVNRFNFYLRVSHIGDRWVIHRKDLDLLGTLARPQ